MGGGLTVRPGVAAIVLDPAGRLLLHRRRVGGEWAPPSGSLEPGESVQAALRREVREETGMAVEPERLVGLYSDPAFQIVAYPDGRRVHFITSLFLCRCADPGRLAGSDEGLDWGWFAPSALPAPLSAYAGVWIADALSGAAAPAIR